MDSLEPGHGLGLGYRLGHGHGLGPFSLSSFASLSLASMCSGFQVGFLYVYTT